MLATVAKKAFALYTAPARMGYAYTLKALNNAREFSLEIRQSQQFFEQFTDDLLARAEHELGLNLATMSREDRLHQATRALLHAESSLSKALKETLKALVLLSHNDQTVLTKGHKPTTIEGEYQRIDEA